MEEFAFGSNEQEFTTMLADEKFDEGCDGFEGAFVHNHDYPATTENIILFIG